MASVAVPLTRQFDLDTHLDIGPYAEHQVDGESLFIDPVRGSWLTLDAADAAVLRRLPLESRSHGSQ